MKIDTILIPYDSTRDSENALHESIMLAKIFHAKIFILFVIEEKHFPKLHISMKKRETIKTKRLEVIKNVENKASEVLKKKVYELGQDDIKASFKIEVGTPIQIISNLAQEINADLIVMGKKGLRKLGRIRAIGSVSRNIAENSPIPVVLIDKSSKNQYRKILVPYDLDDSELSNRVLENAINMKNRINACRIIVINVITPIPIPPFASRMQLRSNITGDPVSVEEYFKELYHSVRKDTQAEISKKIAKYMKNNIEIITKYGDIADKLVEFVQKENINFVFMGLNPHKGLTKIVALGSISRTLAEAIDCPIMLIRK